MGPRGPKHYIFGDQFYSKNATMLRFYEFLHFYARKHMMSSIYLKWAEFTRNFEFVPIKFGSLGTHRWKKNSVSCEFGSLQVKWWYHMFSSIKKGGMHKIWAFWDFSSKSSRQKYSALIPGGPNANLFWQWDVFFWKNIQIFWTKLLQLSDSLA